MDIKENTTIIKDEIASIKSRFSTYDKEFDEAVDYVIPHILKYEKYLSRDRQLKSVNV